MPDRSPDQPYAGFGGEVGRIFSTSEPDWPAQAVASAGSPNVIVMLADDLGFSDLGCYGSEIETPELDRLAGAGLRYTNFHVNPMCSPTRASMLTGLNHHMAGFGHVAHSDPGFPGYAMELRNNAVTLAELFRDNGWVSLMVGKWHLTKDAAMSEASDRSSWPCQKGFDRFYGILEGFTNFHQPHRLVEDNHAVAVDQYPDDYYFTDDITDKAISMVKDVRSSHPTKPWFMYFSHGAVHAPLQAKAVDMDKHRGRYAAGWDAMRQARFDRQVEMGVVPSGTVLPPRNSEPGHEVKAWDELSGEEQELFARYMEVYAAMVDNVDQNFGRLRRELETMGEWDNTIVVFTSDNGGSREGQYIGTSAYFRTLVGQARANDLERVETDYARLDDIGGPRTLPHYPMGWAMVSGTPFRLYKINTHQGGHQVPFIVQWPAGLEADGAIRTQYQHVTDLMPTLAAMTGLEIPTMKADVPVPPPAGASFVASLTDSGVDSTHPEQYYEQIGHRGFYRDGWSAVTCHQPQTAFSTEEWELHDLNSDPTESHNVAHQHPDKLAELQLAWDEAAWANQVFPLDEGNQLKMVMKPPWYEELTEPVVLWPGTETLERFRSQMLITFRDWTVDIKLHWKPGDEGILVAHGDQGGGYSVYVENDHLFYAHNAYGDMTVIDGGLLPDGASHIQLQMNAPGRLQWNLTLRVDGSTVAEHEGLTVLMAMAPFEGIDVGIDRRSPVSWEIYERRGPFAYTGTLTSVTYTTGELAPDAGSRWLDFLKEAGTKFE